MAEGGRVEFDLGIDARRASAELERLRNDLTKITSDFQNAANTIRRNVEQMTRDLRKGLGDPVRARREENAFARATSFQSRGSRDTQIREAATRQLINESRAAAENVTARVTNELVNQFAMRLRNMDEMVQARMRRELAKANRYIAGSTPEMLQAQEILQQRRNEQMLLEARFGRGAVINQNVWERFNARGGAEIMGLQGRLMANAFALSMLWNVMRSGRQFVVELDREFRQFQAITATTNSEMETLSGRLIDVSEKTKFTALEVAKAATVMGQAGLSAREVGDSIEAVTLLATAAGTDLQQAVDITTSVLSIFNLQTRETANVANVLTAALNGSKLTLDKLTLGMQYSGNVAAQLGMTYQELVGVLGALANSGIRSGSTLGTGLRQLLIDIQNPTKALRDMLKQAGLSEEDINIETQGFLTVLNNLKEAGFGAAQAFDVFQVRAAAAFVALSNNIDLAHKLQQEFLLTTAAVEANTTQMQALANTYDKFTSVVGTVAYEAFKPFVEWLQRAIDYSADLLSVLREYPALLETIGILLAGIATATVISTLGTILRSLGSMVPLFASLKTEATAGAAAVGTLTVATSRFSSVMRGLFAIIRTNPITIGLSLLTTAVMGLNTFLDEAETAEKRLDALRGRLNEIQGDLDTIKTQSEAVDQVIANLIKQKAALDRDPLMRQTKILEVVLSFQELAQEIDYTKSSVEELIEALGRLQAIDLAKSVPAYRGMIETLQTLIQEQRQQLELLASQNHDFREAVQTRTGGYSFFGGQAMSQGEIIALYRRMSPDLGRIAQMMFPGVADTPRFPQDITSALATQGIVDAAIGQRQQELLQLTHKRDILRQRLTEEESSRLQQLESELGYLQDLRTAVERRVTIVKDLAANEAKLQRVREEELQAIVKSDQRYRDIIGSIRLAVQEAEGKLSDFARETVGKSSGEMLDGLTSISETFEGSLEEIRGRIRSVAADMVRENPNLDEEKIRSIFKATEEELTASLLLRISTREDKLGKDVKKLTLEDLKEQQRTIEETVKRLVRQISKARSQETVDLLREHIRERRKQLAEVDKRIFELEQQGVDSDKQYELSAEFREHKARRRIEEEEILEALDERSRELVDDYYEKLHESIKDEIDATTKKLRELTEKIKSLGPGEELDKLLSQWHELFNTLRRLLGFSNTTEIHRGLNSFDVIPVPARSSNSANDAMQFFMGKGLPKHIAAGIVSNLLVESNLNPHARGDYINGKPTAFGAAQWRGDRFYGPTGLSGFASRMGSTPWDLMTQLEFIWYELMERRAGGAGRTLDELLKTRTASEASKVFMDLYERPNPNPNVNHIDRRIGYALELAGIDYASQQQKLDALDADRQDAIQAGLEKSIKGAVSVAVANANRQIQAAVAQAKATPDPEVVNSLVETVNEQYKKIIEARTKEFDTKNAEALARGDEEILQQREQMLETIRLEQNQKVAQLLEEYYQKLDDRLSKPIEDAELLLEAAQRPENVGKFTSLEIASMEENIRIAERERLVKALALAEEHLARVREMASKFEAGTPEHTFWINEETRVKQQLLDVQRQLNIEQQVAAQQAPSIASAIQSANVAWGVQVGLLKQNAQSMRDLIDVSVQVENAWTQVLNILSNGFSQLFMDLASGTMSAEEAFRKFALSVIQGFMQMIAKALAYQLILKALEKMGGGGGFFGSLFQGIFTIPGLANGGAIPGAATGELVTGPISTRDSVLRRVQPGEFILRRSAVQAIGRQSLTELNNNGNRIIADGISPLTTKDDKPSVPQTLNVWVVTPDQQPPPGPNDIVAAVADNITRRGSLKTLIKQVQTGTI